MNGQMPEPAKKLDRIGELEAAVRQQGEIISLLQRQTLKFSDYLKVRTTTSDETLVKMQRKIEALETTVQQQGQMIESLKRQVVMFIGFIDTINKFMVSTGMRLERLEPDNHKPKLEVITK